MDGNPAVSGAVYPDESFTYTFTAARRRPVLVPPARRHRRADGARPRRPAARARRRRADVAERVLVLDDVDLDDEGQLRLDPTPTTSRSDATATSSSSTAWSARASRSSSARPSAGASSTRPTAATSRSSSPATPSWSSAATAARSPPRSHDTLRHRPGRAPRRAADDRRRARHAPWLRSAAVDRGHMEVRASTSWSCASATVTEPARSTGRGFTRRRAAAGHAADPGPDADARRGSRSRPGRASRSTTSCGRSTRRWRPCSATSRCGRSRTTPTATTRSTCTASSSRCWIRDGVAERQPAWKDTVDIGAHERLRLAVRHETPGMWMFHCQIPEHAEGGMMGDLMVMESIETVIEGA
jgi:hypothetical protein